MFSTVKRLDELRAVVDAAHQTFSSAYAQHQDAEAALGAAAGVRASLVAVIEKKKKLFRDMRHATIQAAIAGEPGFAAGSACVTALAAEVLLLDNALVKFQAFEFQDALCASLAAKLSMLEKQHHSESLRLEEHVAQIELSLGAAAASNGTLKVEMGGAIDARQRLVFQIARDVDEAHNALRAAEAEARELRDKYESEER